MKLMSASPAGRDLTNKEQDAERHLTVRRLGDDVETPVLRHRKHHKS